MRKRDSEVQQRRAKQISPSGLSHCLGLGGALPPSVYHNAYHPLLHCSIRPLFACLGLKSNRTDLALDSEARSIYEARLDKDQIWVSNGVFYAKIEVVN